MHTISLWRQTQQFPIKQLNHAIKPSSRKFSGIWPTTFFQQLNYFQSPVGMGRGWSCVRIAPIIAARMSVPFYQVPNYNNQNNNIYNNKNRQSLLNFISSIANELKTAKTEQSVVALQIGADRTIAKWATCRCLLGCNPPKCLSTSNYGAPSGPHPVPRCTVLYAGARKMIII